MIAVDSQTGNRVDDIPNSVNTIGAHHDPREDLSDGMSSREGNLSCASQGTGKSVKLSLSAVPRPTDTRQSQQSPSADNKKSLTGLKDFFDPTKWKEAVFSGQGFGFTQSMRNRSTSDERTSVGRPTGVISGGLGFD